MKTVQEDIYTTLTSDATLKTLLDSTSTNGKVFSIVPKNFEDFPCLTYMMLDSIGRTVPTGVEDMTLEFRVFGANKTVCENIVERVKELLQYRQNWDKNIVWIRYSGELDLPEEDRDLWSKVFRFRVWGKKS